MKGSSDLRLEFWDPVYISSTLYDELVPYLWSHSVRWCMAQGYGNTDQMAELIVQPEVVCLFINQVVL